MAIGIISVIDKYPQLVYEFFDHNIDPDENINIVAKSENRAVVEELSKQLKKGWRYSTPK